MSKTIIHRVTLDNSGSEFASHTLGDLQRFVAEAESFGIPSDTPLSRDTRRLEMGAYAPFMVEMVTEVK